MLSRDDIRRAELAFLNAPFDTNGWQVAIQQMADVTRSTVGQLCGIAGGMKLPFNLLGGELHDPHRHLHNPLLYGTENWRIAVSGKAMAIRHDGHYAAWRAAHASSFYDDAMSDLDVPFGCQTALSLTGEDMLGLALLRSHRDGPCTADVLEAFARLSRQAQRAMRVQIALGQESAELMLEGMTAHTEATFLLDRYGAMAAFSKPAEALFDVPHGLVMMGPRLLPAVEAEAASFDSALNRLLKSDGLDGPVVHDFRFGRCEAHPDGRWRGILARLPATGCELGFAPEVALTVKPLD